MLLSFERPAKTVISRRPSGPAWSPAPPTLFADLENYTVANELWVSPGRAERLVPKDHRQDSKGTRWMPWHQESMKDVNGCDKPRLGAE